ncbi:hypothetical protein SAMN05216276_101036 [Streptosporangium subroseum]|uniref:Uncharacterized protein n=1 Tax=Streptosporangium subroseum TaxID=106412 RepID=A0A239ES26_9ACTN|nr:hypothetical protein [Streptosporangium subroseum]SNS47379.1 hypothetical protein SAMN05216276_101036 [Streptosporangium subroseum]
MFPEAATLVDEATTWAVGRAVAELGAFVGADKISYGDKVAEPWRPA